MTSQIGSGQSQGDHLLKDCCSPMYHCFYLPYDGNAVGNDTVCAFAFTSIESFKAWEPENDDVHFDSKSFVQDQRLSMLVFG